MKSKGLIEIVSIAIVTLIMAGTIATLGTQSVVSVGDLIQRESLGIMGERIESTVYALDSFDQAKVEMNLGSDRYKIYSESGEKYISYTYGGENNTYLLQNPYGIPYSVEGDSNDQTISKICISKDGGIAITKGGC